MRTLQSDNGGEFKNDVVTEWAEKNGVQLSHGLPGNPEADGCVERVIQTIDGGLKQCCPLLGERNNRVEKGEKVPVDWVDQ
jgi:transposase InsO family protein